MTQELVIFDWETTSPKPATTRGVQFAAYSTNHGQLWNQLCDPEVDIHHEAAEVHGITSEMVKGQPKDYEVASEFVNFWHTAQRPITAGHNSSTFDIPITNRLAKVGGCALRIEGLHIDSLVLAQRVYPNAPSHRLSATEAEAKKPGAIGLTQWLKLGTGEGAHDAMVDCKLVFELIRRISLDSGKSIEELAAWCAQPYVHDICFFGKHAGKKWGRGPGVVPFYYVKWMTENIADPSVDMVATIKHHYGMEFKKLRRSP